jgi:hypothetical protein
LKREARAFHKMKMKPRIVATAILRTNGKWAGVEKFGVYEIVERPAETAPGARGSNLITGELGMGLNHSSCPPQQTHTTFSSRRLGNLKFWLKSRLLESR